MIFLNLLSFYCHQTKKEPRNAVNSTFLSSCVLLKLYVGDYILGLVSFLRCIFGMEITVIIACLREFGEGCRQRVDNPNYFLPVIVPALRHLRSESFVSSNIRCFFHIYSNQLLDSQSNK